MALRAVVEAIFCIATTGCQWRQLPKDFPPYSTVQGYCYAWACSGLMASINHLLVVALREKVGREASPSAGAIDSQSVKTTEAGGLRGLDAGKKIKGSVTSSSIRRAIYSALWFTGLKCRIATARRPCLLR